ncbi:DUF4255 domain-containing protein [Kribbella sp. NBC_01505]|uniref:Pvc16 family protein n=1 Tax=Kribbella sp. NBC_01505 TaxID=2903580 RepID=UPI003863DA4F
MLDELGAAICSRLGDVLPPGTAISLEPPSQTLAGRSTVDLFLYQILENPDGGSAGLWTEERDADGRVASRVSPEKRYDFYYLLTAWSATLELELGLLGKVLRSVAHAPTVPADRLTGSMSQARGTVTLSIGRRGFQPVQSDLWSALGLSPRACLGLVATPRCRRRPRPTSRVPRKQSN